MEEALPDQRVGLARGATNAALPGPQGMVVPRPHASAPMGAEGTHQTEGHAPIGAWLLQLAARGGNPERWGRISPQGGDHASGMRWLVGPRPSAVGLVGDDVSAVRVTVVLRIRSGREG